MSEGFSNSVLGGQGTLVRPQIASPNFNIANPAASPTPSWALLKNGLLYVFGIILSGGSVTGPDFILNDTGMYSYSGTPGAGNLVSSEGVPPGTTLDPTGRNAVFQGSTDYSYNIGHTTVTALQKSGGALTAWTAATQAGPYTEVSAITFDTGGNVNVPGPLKLGAARVTVPPGSGGADDAATISSWLASGYAVDLVPGTYTIASVLQFPGGAVITAPGPQVTILRASVALSAVMASTGWTTSANVTSQAPVKMSGFRVDGNALATYGLVSQNFWSYFDDLECINAIADDFRFDAFGQNGATEFNAGVTAVENHVTNCQFRLPGSGGACFRVHDSIINQHFTDGWLVNNVMQGPGSSATVPILQIDVLAGWKVDGNHLYGAGVTAMSGQRAFNSRIVNNYVEPWGTSATAGSYAGIGIDGITDGGFGSSVIGGNTLDVDATSPGNAASTIDGISCRVTSGASGGLAVTGNTVSNPEPVAAHYRGAITLQTQNAAATMNVVTTGNLAGAGWTNTVDIITNGGVINHTAGV